MNEKTIEKPARFLASTAKPITGAPGSQWPTQEQLSSLLDEAVADVRARCATDEQRARVTRKSNAPCALVTVRVAHLFFGLPEASKQALWSFLKTSNAHGLGANASQFGTVGDSKAAKLADVIA